MTSTKNYSAEDLSSTREVRGDGFLFISFLLLAIPLFYLSYEFNKANEEEIVFAQSENNGLSSLLEQDHLYVRQRNDFVEKVFRDCSVNLDDQMNKLKLERETILDDSNLILDPQMETYHLIVASQKVSYSIEKEILDFYRFYLNCTGRKSSDTSLYSSSVQNSISEALLSYKKFCSKDCPPHFRLSYEKYESLLLDVVHLLELHLKADLRDKVILTSQIRHFFESSDSLRLQSNSLIESKLNERITKYNLRRSSVLAATLILWLASLICSYIFYSINLKKIRNYITHIQNQNEELERVKKLSLLGELAAGIGHEINNPLSVAAISLELINRKLDMENSSGSQRDDIKSLLIRIDKMISNIKQIIRSFKSFSYSGDDEKISYISLQEVE